MRYKELKTKYEAIGKTYSIEVLSGYISFFSTLLKEIRNKRNSEYRINRLRLMVYRRLLKEKTSVKE